jgi:hypothetical protein
MSDLHSKCRPSPMKLAGLFWLATLAIGVLVTMVGLARGETPYFPPLYPYGVGDHDGYSPHEPIVEQPPLGQHRAQADAHPSDCSSTTQRVAMAEYDTIAGMVGIPAGAPIYTLEKRQYVAAVCLHETLREGR